MTTTHEPAETVYKPCHKLMIDNFIGGISWGIGSVIGATVIVAVIGFLLAQSQNVPFIGQIVTNITTQVQASKNQFKN